MCVAKVIEGEEKFSIILDKNTSTFLYNDNLPISNIRI